MLPGKESLREFIANPSSSFKDSMDGHMEKPKEKEGRRIPPERMVWLNIWFKW